MTLKKIMRTGNSFYYMLEKKEHNFYRKWKKQLKKVLFENVKTMVKYQSKKLTIKFPVKDKIDFQHQNNVLYYGKCPKPNCKYDRNW